MLVYPWLDNELFSLVSCYALVSIGVVKYLLSYVFTWINHKKFELQGLGNNKAESVLDVYRDGELTIISLSDKED